MVPHPPPTNAARAVLADVGFPVAGESLPTDHSYPLYAALSRVLPDFHRPEARTRFAPINGDRGERGTIRLTTRSRLRVRLPGDAVGRVLALVGRELDVAGRPVRLGTPMLSPLRPATSLAARLVTFKNAVEPGRFLAAAAERLGAMGVEGTPGIPVVREGGRSGEPRRRVVRIGGRQVVGYALQVDGLTAEESLRLQEDGLGGRTQIGCGFFLPLDPRA